MEPPKIYQITYNDEIKMKEIKSKITSKSCIKFYFPGKPNIILGYKISDIRYIKYGKTSACNHNLTLINKFYTNKGTHHEILFSTNFKNEELEEFVKVFSRVVRRYYLEKNNRQQLIDYYNKAMQYMEILAAYAERMCQITTNEQQYVNFNARTKSARLI